MSSRSISRFVIAISAGVLFHAVALLAPSWAGQCLCCGLAWYICFLVIGIGSISLATSSNRLRFLLGALSAAFGAGLFFGFVEYSLLEDRMVFRQDGWAAGVVPAESDSGDEFLEWWDSSIFPAMLASVLLSFAPVYHVLRIERQLGQEPEPLTLFRRIWRSGVRGAVQSLLVVIVVLPLMLTYLWPVVSGIHLPPEIREGPARNGKLPCVLTIAAAVVVAGVTTGAATALSYSASARRDDQPPTPPGRAIPDE
jgi:hypothetical protein